VQELAASAEKIGSVQQATQQTVAAIQEIARTITEMSQISTSIAAAMEQGAATAEIARSVQEAARGKEQVTGIIRSVQTGLARRKLQPHRSWVPLKSWLATPTIPIVRSQPSYPA
jgi:methyl-accepting chemotaxis protein